MFILKNYLSQKINGKEIVKGMNKDIKDCEILLFNTIEKFSEARYKSLNLRFIHIFKNNKLSFLKCY